MSGRRGRHVCIVVQNLPVPFDRRVWNECRALRAAGYEVSAVCPKGTGEPAYQELEGVHLYRYRAFPPITHQAMFLAEYAWSVLATFALLIRAWRRQPFGVVQVCNPPDVLCAAVIPFQVLFGVRLVYDQHDLCPELYLSRFDRPASLPYRALLLAERLTYRLAAQVISTNESYRRLAIERGGKRPGEVTVVRTGPDPQRLHRGEPDPALRRGFRHLLVYIGVMARRTGSMSRSGRCITSCTCAGAPTWRSPSSATGTPAPNCAASPLISISASTWSSPGGLPTSWCPA